MHNAANENNGLRLVLPLDNVMNAISATFLLETRRQEVGSQSFSILLSVSPICGHLMQWWENSRRPHFSVVPLVAQQPAAQQPVVTKPAEMLTPSLFLAAVQDGQDRNVGPLPHPMALTPVKLPKF